MADYEALKARVQELAERDWDRPAIEARYKRLAAEGIPRKTLNRDEVLANKQQIMDRVQRQGEEYNLLAGNCAKGTALALMEEFGLGNMEIVKALSPFPGFGGTGWMCGGVTGSLIALGLFFGSDDLLDYDAVGATIMAARKFMPRFEEQAGSVICPKLQEDVIFATPVYDEMVAAVLELIDQQGAVTAKALRDHFNTSRKYAISLLEHLDTLGVTRRVGDERVRGRSTPR